MPEGEAQRDGRPCAEEIRAALEHMAGSEAFRGSPQLVSFLRYVVEATLRGTSDRIKGYTIAVEALGRAEDFDPQADPIVRVEAMRLRRALSRYYENGGKRDPVLIDLPLGSYVPAFRRNAPAASALDETPAGPTPPLQCAAPSDAAPPATPPAAPLRRLTRFAAAAALLLAGAAIYAGLEFWLDFGSPGPHASIQTSPPRANEPARPQSPFPMVYVGRFEAENGGEAARAVANQLRGKLRDALARFDELTIVSGAPPAEARGAGMPDERSSRYELSAGIETDAAGGTRVALLLSDLADGRIAFARTFQHGGEPNSAQEAIVREIATTIAQPYGIIHARERVAQMGSPAGDPRYRCLLASYDYWRTYSATQHAAVRDCLERVTKADPSFAAGFAALAEIVLQEQRHHLNVRPGDAPALERATRAARRAVELKPGSAYAYQALMDVHFLRGEYALALQAGERAVTLNPYHPNMLGCYGARLVALGQVEKGARYLREAADAFSVRPAWLEFHLFLASYMLNDRHDAALHTAQIMADTYPQGYVARAIVAAQAGRPELAREYFATLAVLQPSWRDDPFGAARRVFPADAVANRVAGDIAQIAGNLGQ